VIARAILSGKKLIVIVRSVILLVLIWLGAKVQRLGHPLKALTDKLQALCVITDLPIAIF